MADPTAPEEVPVDWVGADLPEPDLDAPLIEHRYERTTPRDTGAPWDMAAWIAADRARREAEGAFDAGGESEVVVPAWRPEVDDLPTKPKGIAKRLQAAGWEVRMSTGTVYVARTLYVGNAEDHSRGDVRYPDHDDTWWSVQAVMRKGEKAVAAFWGSWVTKEQVGAKPSTKFLDATTQDLVLGREFTKVAGEFEEWLAIFCPPPPKATKKKPETKP